MKTEVRYFGGSTSIFLPIVDRERRAESPGVTSDKFAMKVCIRNKRAKTYYASPGHWVASAADAHDFQSAQAAVETAVREYLAGSEVVLSSDNTGAEIVLPLRLKRRG